MKCVEVRKCIHYGRIALIAMVCVIVICGVCLMVGADETKNEKTSRNEIGDSTPTKLAVVREKPAFTSEEILARFPKEKHEEFMRRAIANSRKAGVQYKTGGAFGAVIVDADGEILADGINHVVGENDPTWHGEMHAIRQACALLKKPKLDGCVLYTSSEPCPMCLATAYWAGLDGIIYGATVADSKQYGNFDDEFIYEELAKPAKDRAISEQSLLRPEAVEVWKEYSDRTDKVDY